ncbi:hypothetical protein M409DRAFT_59763 [Zasmidium cellare ATCC 36951]|uniref:SANT domain-containing protein n=1 Tax=Zasmidium cellare ATCC 36951 TaxID=1080233 RepID=A0A6A6C4S2_ZASCE|nr:uncharacterized protein M409DRAFT_59763 [Zasmidium cellare ATCC 36951]KAF2160739.1 hypothetical protein M409DRAFT_59763 [Zasmidium cellare ATCC 36951]
MSYRGSGYRGPGDRSRSPPRFADRRPSNASIFDGRHPGPPPRNASDAPRGPRSQFDGPPTRGPPPGGLGSGGAPRTLRDAPPLGTTDRSRSFIRERDYPDRRERSPPPRERSPPRKFPEPRDFPPRDLDVRSARRASRDGPPSAGSNYSDNPPLSSSRGGFGGRGRGRGDFFDRGSTRGGRRPFDDRADLFRRERSPPPRFGRDLSRDSRDAERRDERRFERREDERRPEWLDRERERERELDRPRRDPPVGRLESRMSTESVPTSATHQSAQSLPINPERLAILESSGADTSIRRPSSASIAAPKRETPSETPAYLNGRADATANRYGSRGSSPPTQAPPVPAFSFSVAPSAAAHQVAPGSKSTAESRSLSLTDERPAVEEQKPALDDKSAPPANAPTAPKAAPSAPKAHHASPPPTAPKAPRALEIESTIPASNRLQGVRSLENLAGPNNQAVSQSAPVPPSPLSSRQSLPHLTSPHPPAVPRHADVTAPTGPKAVRPSPGQSNISPRPAFASPRSDAGVFQHASGISRGQTPPPSAPSGPRNRSFSVSPKVQASVIPTAPKAARASGPPRGGDRTMPPQSRPPERHAAMPSFAPPIGPKMWHQWRRPGAPGYMEKSCPAIPAKRDSNGDEKDKAPSGHPQSSVKNHTGPPDVQAKLEDHDSAAPSTLNTSHEDRMDIDEPPRRKSNHNESQGHSARQSFFGKRIEKSEDEIASSSEDDLSEDEDETLLEAKHARKERQLKEQMVDLGERQYRAMTPLESIARLARLTTNDLERVAAQRDDDMDVDDDVADAPLPVPAVVHTSESDDGPDIPTPQGDDAAGASVRKDATDVVPRIRRPTPEVISLPYLFKGEEAPPLHEDDAFQDNLKSLEEPGDEVMAVLEEEIEAEAEAASNIEQDFAELYRAWREECESLDKVKEDAEKDRQQSAEPGPEFDAALTAPINPVLEGRRLHKYSSEYALEQVLKQSEETARIEQERQDREAKKVQADMEKEARLPDQLWPQEAARYNFINANRLREPETLTQVFSYLPPADTFTDKEQDVFIAAFKETPKKWGEIASLLPGRTYKDCIHHYYAFKWDNRFRDNRGKKLKGGRRGRGGKGSRPSRGSALMADLRGGEELVATSDTTTGRPKRAAAPTTFGEREVESKSLLANPSPAKKLGPGSKEGNGENGEKPAKKPRRTGDAKPGRKGKTQLAALAAAPSTSPNKPFLPPGVHTQEEMARAQSLEDANLLANLQAGPSLIPDQATAMMFDQERFNHMTEGPDRPRPTVSAPKTGASSYWSVPEQTDFFKYIEHFGTDFGAIATHMGTKTQTMIKNHYQRQIDGGRGDLEKAAMAANTRREAGVDIGPPPTPTPIVKRKYDNPQSSTPRTIAPQTEAGNIEEAMPPSHAVPPKHASPPQAAYQPKPQYSTSAQSTPIPAQRAVPSPLPVASTPAPAPMPAAAHPRGGLQHPLGSRRGFLTSESRPGAQPPSPFRLGQEQATPAAAPRSQPPPAQPTRTLSNVSNEFMNSLRQEQERALRMQAEYDTDPRVEQLQQQPPGHIPHTHGSPASQPIAAPPPDRKPLMEERAPTPPRAGFPPIASTRQPLFGPNAGPMHSFSTPLPPFAARGSYNQSPTKPETSRPGSVPTSAPLPPPAQAPMPSATPAPAAAPTPAPEPPKRSNLLSILNSEPEEPKPAKRDSLPTPSRVASPGPASFPPSSTPQPMPGIQSSRRETFGQPSMPHSHFHRPSYSQTSSTPVPPPATLKHEPSSGGMRPMQSAPKQDWPPRMMGPGSHPSPPNPTPLDRDGRPAFYQPHRSSMLGLGTPRAGPSPPPNALHSRTPSLSAQQQSAPPRDQRSILSGPPQGTPHQTSQPLHSNPYGVQPQQYPPFSQAPTQINRAHHSHNSSINEGVSILQRMHGSREEAMRYEEEARANEEQRVRQRYDAIHAEKQRADQMLHAQRADQMLHAQRVQEQEMERQRQQQQQEQSYGRGPLPPHAMHPSGFSSSPFPQPRAGITLREQAAREAETAVAQEQRRFHEEQERRRQEHQQQMPPQGYRDAQTDFRRRADDPLYHQRRTTPYGGPPYAPPPPPGSRR